MPRRPSVRKPHYLPAQGSLRTQFPENPCKCPVEHHLRKILLWAEKGIIPHFSLFWKDQNSPQPQKASSVDVWVKSPPQWRLGSHSARVTQAHSASPCLCPCWPLTSPREEQTVMVTAVGLPWGKPALKKGVPFAYLPESAVRGEGPALCSREHLHGVKHLPSAAGQKAFKSCIQSRFSLWKPPDGGAWTQTSFTLPYRFSLGQGQTAPCCPTTAQTCLLRGRARFPRRPSLLF